MAATTPAATLGWDQVIAWRAARHHLVERAPAKTMLAMDEVTRRFLAASGPVTREDFARWWGASPARPRAAGCWSAWATRRTPSVWAWP